ncbi:DJ-1/PfpI family protein [Cytophagaceae bacterium YF14B1]|uniref:DJ-1/PfpI family protein n=1 Tax=Xanthocytophaga flava TaxID=3048013 RepID=A0AAE3UA26_9BACT|nr:DJ-1/PfpI family protein [Xanthocytophaga flavus]MDJ1485071.1 DJ-1/PfpI family protein [Xanthocytophaga flavus]
MKVTIVAFDQCTDIDVFLPWDLFNRVRLIHPEWSIRIVGTKAVHTSATGLPVTIHGDIEECNAADIVFFSSGAGTRSLIKDPSYLNRFTLNPEKQLIGSMCSGSLLLAALGLLNGLTATTYPSVQHILESMGITVVEEPLVVHGNIATAAGCLAALDLVGWMVEKTVGTETKDRVLASVQPVGKLTCIY